MKKIITRMVITFYVLSVLNIFVAAQNEPQLLSMWTSSGQCDFGCCRLEIGENNMFVMAWIINTIDYGTYILKGDTLELKVTESRDYYEGNGSKFKSNKTWRFLIKGEELVPFYYDVVFNDKVSVLINTIDTKCTVSFLKGGHNLNRF